MSTSNKDLIFPFLLECCKFCNGDIFWTNVFFELAHGKPPYGCYLSKNYLICSFPKKEFAYLLVEKNPRLCYEELYSLFTNKMGLLSSTEKIQKKVDFNSTESNIKQSRQSWGTIRKKNIKELLIEKFVIVKKNEYRLSIKQAQYLMSLIFLAMSFKIITSKDIECEDGKIVNISGIEFQKGKVFLTKNLYNFEESYSTIVIDRQSMSDNWETFLKENRKNSLL